MGIQKIEIILLCFLKGYKLEYIDPIVEKLNSHINHLQTFSNEFQLQNFVSAILNCKNRVKLEKDNFPSLEVDILCEDYALELKFEAKYYDGFCQAMIYRDIYKIKNVILLHVRLNKSIEFINAIRALSKLTKIPVILVFLRDELIMVIT